MKLHRFYVGSELELKQDFWIHDSVLVHQLGRVLRLRPEDEIVLFDGAQTDRLYKILEITPLEVHVHMVTEFERKVPKKDMYLFWSLLKKDKNDWVLQKCTELGVSHFVPLLSERTEKMGFDAARATKIAIEAAEQCGRSDIPAVHEPMQISHVFSRQIAKNLQFVVCEQSAEVGEPQLDSSQPIGLLIGPEGGWSDNEKQLFKKQNVQHLNLHDFTLRAETASVTAVSKIS
jgi:16S rRNA (uracil1498-N3)-methyltransferase